MDIKTYIKLFSGKIVTESKLDNQTKIQLLNYIQETDVYEVMTLLMDGQIKTVSEQSKPIILERFKKSDIPQKIKYFVEQEKASKIDKDDVKQAAIKTAKKVHGKVDKKIVNDMVDKAIKKGKDTEDAIQIVINMLRS